MQRHRGELGTAGSGDYEWFSARGAQDSRRKGVGQKGKAADRQAMATLSALTQESGLWLSRGNHLRSLEQARDVIRCVILKDNSRF